MRSRIATLVYANVGEPPAAVELVDLRSRRTPNQPTQIVAILKNTGRRTVRTRGTSRCSTPSGAVVGQTSVPDVPVLPESEREVAIALSDPDKPAPPAGDYRVEVRIDAGMPRRARRRNDGEASLGHDVAGKLATIVVALGLCASAPAAAQQGSVQLSSETQIVASDPSRRTGEPGFQPDFGINWMEPQAWLRAIPAGSPRDQQRKQRPAGPHLHRRSRPAVARLQVDVRGRRHLYDAGNRLSILESLGAVGHVQRRVDPRAQRADVVPGSRRPVDGAAKCLRHQPGRPRPDAGNRASQLPGVRSPATQRSGGPHADLGPRRIRPHRRCLGSGRASAPASSPTRCGSSSPTDRTCTIARPGPRRYVSDYSYLAGTHVLLPRGWIQVNASRFSPGDLPVLNASLQDRSGHLFRRGVRRARPPAALRGLGERQHQHQPVRNGATPSGGHGRTRIRRGARAGCRAIQLHAARGRRRTTLAPGHRHHAVDAGDTSGQRHGRRQRRVAIVTPGAHRVRTILPSRKRRYLVNGLELHAARFVRSVLPERLAPTRKSSASRR